ncbi:NfeD family protein [Arcobacter sp. FWKO B]|uniref:NfeD family protein n=1 Tax=Arcobacter sp. FWKO B TaxID=2593672 RepID=UPI0018A4AACA|nr:nodulation protein NfeD [Arcobacter sp. FWKO B]QOG12117.1 nodulation protein NfeD [Arcobacter sp. FWKO B]
MKRLLFLILLPLMAFASNITHMKVDGPISVASAQYIKDGIDYASALNSELIILELNTSGGLLDSTREIIQSITASKIPVAVYVSPKGSHAASAGTYILYSSHIAVMAPGTNIGATTPVSMFGFSFSKDDENVITMQNKALTDATAYIKSLAELRQRDVNWAIKSVQEGVSISAIEALELGVIDMIADNIVELYTQLDQKTIKIDDNTSKTLDMKHVDIKSFEMDYKTKILSILTNPNTIYILMLVAIYGIFFEFLNPGSILPGSVGIICAIVVLYSLNIIPFNYAGLILIFIGIAFMTAEIFAPGFGIFGFAGIVSFVTGSLLLFDSQTLGDDISIPLIISFSILSLIFFIYILRTLLKSRNIKAKTGIEEMIGSEATVLKKSENGYFVHCHGETWEGVSSQPLQQNQIVIVEDIKGLVLHLKPKE